MSTIGSLETVPENDRFMKPNLQVIVELADSGFVARTKAGPEQSAQGQTKEAAVENLLDLLEQTEKDCEEQ